VKLVRMDHQVVQGLVGLGVPPELRVMLVELVHPVEMDWEYQG